MTDPTPHTPDPPNGRPPRGRRLGGPPPTPSTVTDTTPPEATPPEATTPDIEPPRPPAPVSAGAAPALGPVGLGWTRPADGQDQAAELPRAEQLCGPRQKIEREQVTAHVPAQLRLRRRLALYAINHDTDVQDVVAVALDQWLRAQNA